MKNSGPARVRPHSFGGPTLTYPDAQALHIGFGVSQIPVPGNESDGGTDENPPRSGIPSTPAIWRMARIRSGLTRSVSVSSIVHKAALIEDGQGAPMADISADLLQELDQLQAGYRAAVDEWVKAIREEETLASGNHSVAELDKWEAACFHENKKQREVIHKKKLYEDALRREFYGF
jgi:hypothetical protein